MIPFMCGVSDLMPIDGLLCIYLKNCRVSMYFQVMVSPYFKGNSAEIFIHVLNKKSI